jgi:hypothetical protein
MTEEENNDLPDYKPVTVEAVIRILSILFVLGIYTVIFLKIIVLN